MRSPSSSIIADYPWLDLPDGATLEGRLGSGVINVPISTDADGFVRMLLDRFAVQVPAELRGDASDGRSFDDVLTLASIVEREAADFFERPAIAEEHAQFAHRRGRSGRRHQRRHVGGVDGAGHALRSMQGGGCAFLYVDLVEPGARVTPDITRNLFAACQLDPPELHVGRFDHTASTCFPSPYSAVALRAPANSSTVSRKRPSGPTGA